MASSSKRQRTTTRRGSPSQAPQIPPQPQPQVQPPPQPQPPINVHLSFLNNPTLSTYFDKISTYDIQQDRFVNFLDLQNYDIDTLFEASGLLNLLSFNHMTPCFPYLVKLFYTNMETTTPPQPTALTSNVMNHPIRLSSSRLGSILDVPHVGSSLKSIKMNNPTVLSRMLFPDREPKAGLNSIQDLRPQARIISRILSWSIIPKSGSYSYVSLNLLKATYAIMAEMSINWARVIYDNLTKPTSKILHHGSFLTLIFKAFDVDLLMEGLEVLPQTPYFDRTALSRMSLPYDPNAQHSGSEEEEQSDNEEEEEEEEAPHQPHLPGYNDLIQRVDNLALAQGRVEATNYVVLNELSNLRRYQQALTASLRDLRADQRENRESNREILRRFNQQFPPPAE